MGVKPVFWKHTLLEAWGLVGIGRPAGGVPVTARVSWLVAESVRLPLAVALLVSIIQCGGESVIQGTLPRTPCVGGGASPGRAVTHFGDSGAKSETEQPCVQTTREEGGDVGRGRSHGYRARAKLDPPFSRL